MDVFYTDHLVGLVADAEGAAVRLAGADPDRRAAVAAAARREQAYLSARLDGSPLERATAAEVDAGEDSGTLIVDPPERADGGPGGWARVLKLDAMGTQEVAAVEYANLLRCFDAEPALAERLFSEPGEVLETLHEHICRGFVDADLLGALRRSDQAVHDGAQGMVIYNVPDPASLPALVDQLVGWLQKGAAQVPTVVLAGILHERILEWQPFEAGNGRVARAAGRLVLRGRAMDPHGVCVPERQFSADPRAYYGEVAATIRRRGDLRRWLERHTEALVAALAEVETSVGAVPAVSPPDRAKAVVAALEPGEQVSVAEYAERAGVSLHTAFRELRGLVRTAVVRLEPGTQGLRYRRP